MGTQRSWACSLLPKTCSLGLGRAGRASLSLIWLERAQQLCRLPKMCMWPLLLEKGDLRFCCHIFCGSVMSF
jgi:hypothetical protein